jgi:hypothetical protein
LFLRSWRIRMHKRRQGGALGAGLGLLLAVPGFWLGANTPVLIDKLTPGGIGILGAALEVPLAICGAVLPPVRGGPIGLAVGSRAGHPHEERQE